MENAFDAKWLSGVLESTVSDESAPVTMDRFKRIIKCVAEDGNYFRAITILEDIKVKLGEIEKHVDQGVAALGEVLDGKV